MKTSVNVILILALFLIAAVAISGCSQYGGNQSTQPPAPLAPPQAQPAPAPAPEPAPAPASQTLPAAKSSVKTVYISVLGFGPSIVVIKAGDMVRWVNNDTVQHWPASAAHPTHTVYTEPGGCIGSKFDACHGLAFGEQWNFTFNAKGTWSYHDHLKTISRGRIVVE